MERPRCVGIAGRIIIDRITREVLIDEYHGKIFGKYRESRLVEGLLILQIVIVIEVDDNIGIVRVIEFSLERVWII